MRQVRGVVPNALFAELQVVKQVQKNSSIIEQVVYAIAGAEIVREPPHAGDVLDLQVQMLHTLACWQQALQQGLPSLSLYIKCSKHHLWR